METRITIFDPTGKTAWAATAEAKIPRGRHLLDLYDLGGNGFAVTAKRKLRQRPRGISRDSVFLAVLDQSGKQSATIGMVGDNEYVSAETQLLVPYSYRFLAAGTERAFYVGTSRGPELTEYHANGRAARRLKLPIDRMVITPGTRALVRDRFLERFEQRDRADVRATLKRAELDSFPAFTDLKPAFDGALWLQLYDLPGSPRCWLVVDTNARTARRIVLPPATELLDATHDRIAVLLRDDYDREAVHVYRFAQSAIVN